MNIDSLLMWIIIGLVVVIGIPFTLWWWKVADKWADAEHRRFKQKTDGRERVVVKQGTEPGPSHDQSR
ncbi:MAG: hypothetical protein ACOYN0_08485 [Phycisphaerales bacterium]